MPIPAWQLVNVRVRGQIDNQAADVPSLWYYHKNVSAQDPKFLVSRVAQLWQANLLPLLTSQYSTTAVEGWTLNGLMMKVEGPTGGREFKGVREIWGERFRNVDYTGAGSFGNLPMPSFVALGATKTVGPSYEIQPSTGLVELTPASTPM